MTTSVLVVALAMGSGMTGGGGPGPAEAPLPWGMNGHEMAARAAVRALPDGMPAFFRAAGDQLVWLDPEPDRWRNRERRAMDQAWSYDHYIDMENVPEGALDSPDRFRFLRALYDAGVPVPERDAGFLPYRIHELYQRLVTGFELLRAERDPERREWIEERIVNDAGILGHYVTDASQPHHTTIHFNGWNDADAFGNAWPNPEGYTGDDSFHWRFESLFVDAHVGQVDVDRFMPSESPRAIEGSVWDAILGHIMESHDEVERLYRLDKEIGFDPEAQMNPTTRDFAAERLASGGAMLSLLWWSAWEESGR